jgi:iron uptake system component EfeO
MKRGPIAIAGLAIVIVAAGGAVYLMARPAAAPPAGTGSNPPQQEQAAVVPVNVTASVCEPMALTVPAGPVTFSIHNAGTRALEWEILDGVMVVDERENIAPGFTQRLTTRLEPGDYDITCGLLSNPKGKLHVAASVAASKPSQMELVGPLAEYRVFASYEVDALVDDAGKFADAVKSGNRDSARALFVSAHAHYARLAPIAGLFPDLDRAIDASVADQGKKEMDPAFTGFHRLEWGLFGDRAPGDLAPLADRLATDVAALQAGFENLAMNPEPTIAGAATVMGRTALARIGGEVDRYSGADLSDLQANAEGVKKLVDLFLPLIEKADRPLSGALAQDLATLDATLAKYKIAGGAFEPPANLSREDRMTLRNTTTKLAEELTRVRGALGLS